MKIQLKDVTAKKAIGGVMKVLTDKIKTNREIARKLKQFVYGTFRSETDPWGNPWPPHSPVTTADRYRQGEDSAQMLIMGGALYASIQESATVEGARVEAGAGLEYAAVHQFGNPNNMAWGRGHAPIPQRAFFPMRTPDEAAFPDEWIEAVYEPIDKALKEAAGI